MNQIFILVLFFSSTSYAATQGFHVESEISIDGEIVAKPHFLTLPGHRAKLTDIADPRITQVELVAQDDAGPTKSDAIMMKFKVAINQAGEEKIHEPTIIARPGMPAELAVGNSKGRELFRMKVVANRE